MRARIHEIISSDEGYSYNPANIRVVEDLDEELERLDQSGFIFTVSASTPDKQLEGLNVWITFFI